MVQVRVDRSQRRVKKLVFVKQESRNNRWRITAVHEDACNN